MTSVRSLRPLAVAQLISFASVAAPVDAQRIRAAAEKSRGLAHTAARTTSSASVDARASPGTALLNDSFLM